MSELEKALATLAKFINFNALSYQEENKAKFKRMGRKTFDLLAKELGLKKYEVRFNPGGIAVSGDLVLHGMFTDEAGIYINLNQGGFSEEPFSCYFRTVKSLTDYAGGGNNWITSGDFPQIAGRVKKLCGV